MIDPDDVSARAAQAAATYLPPFCTVLRSGEMEVLDLKTWKAKKVLYAKFTFPGATAEGFWNENLRDMVTVDQADYHRFQRLKSSWIAQQRRGERAGQAQDPRPELAPGADGEHTDELEANAGVGPDRAEAGEEGETR